MNLKYFERLELFCRRPKINKLQVKFWVYFKYYQVKLEFKSFIEFKYTGYDSLALRVKFLFQVFNHLTFTFINLSFTEKF